MGLQHAWKSRVLHTKFGHTATTGKGAGRLVQMFKGCLPPVDATPCVVSLTTNPSYSEQNWMKMKLAVGSRRAAFDSQQNFATGSSTCCNTQLHDTRINVGYKKGGPPSF